MSNTSNQNEQSIPQQEYTQYYGSVPPNGTVPPNSPDSPYSSQPYATPIYPPRTPYQFASGDAIFAAFMIVVGFLFWEWQVVASGLSAFLFFVVGIAGCLTYFKHKGIPQNIKSLVCLGVLSAGTLPFLLYGFMGIHIPLVMFEFAAFMTWIALTCRTTVSENLSGFIASDLINQGFVVSFGNFVGLFGSIRAGMGKAKSGKKVLAGIVGVIVAIPVILIVVSLLVSADSGFESFTTKLMDSLDIERIGVYILEFVVGIPIACYIYGIVHGNTYRRKTTCITKEATARSIATMHVIPRVSIYVPIVILNLLYIVFFVVMAPYLFSAFGANLPDGYTYSEYARKGFFELLGVASINLGILVFTYLFARRNAQEYPKSLRILTGSLSILTTLLILTAASKMLMYIGAYGLSQLRVYTLWFMILLLTVFVILIIWHIRPFNAGSPIVIAFAAAVLTLFLTNTDGLIAKYNVDNYLNGNLKTVDIDMMRYMSPAVVPHLEKLSKDYSNTNTNTNVRALAGEALFDLKRDYSIGQDSFSFDYRFHSWNLTSARVFQTD